ALRGVSDRTRTGDRLDHNQELYQLSYAHRAVGSLDPRQWEIGTVSSAIASTTSTSSFSSSSRAQTMRNAPVPRFGSPSIGRPRIVSQPRRSTSKGFIRTAIAGNSQVLLW